MLRNFQRLIIQSTNQISSKNPTYSIINQFSTTAFNLSENANNKNSNIKEKIDNMVKEQPVVLFMKGTPNAPRCGFSRNVVQILQMHDVKYASHNILDDEELRAGIKEYSNWPTIPQIFFKGEFIGGHDILLDMHRTGELIEELKKIGIKSRLEESEEGEKKK